MVRTVHMSSYWLDLSNIMKELYHTLILSDRFYSQ